jgi:hypothetical protein
MATIVSVRRLFRQTGCNFVGQAAAVRKTGKVKCVMQLMLQMDKIGISRLKQAAEKK